MAKDPSRFVIPPVRPAARGDVGAVQACVVAAFEPYVDRLGEQPRPMRLDFAAEVDAGRVWVAEQEAAVVGTIIQYETDRGFYIDVVAALPQMQGRGVGKALLMFAEQEAQRRGFDAVYLCTNSKMTENQVLYPKIGYIEFERQREGANERVYYAKALRSTRPPPAG